MKKSFISALLCLLCISTAHAGDIEQNYISMTEAAISFVDQNQYVVWPGFHISKTPTILYFSDTQHIYAFRFIPKNPDWQKLIVRNQPIYYLDHDEIGAKEMDDMEFDKKIDEQSSFVIKPFSNVSTKDMTHDVIALAHERFHMYEILESRFSRSSIDYSVHPYIGLNKTNITLSYLELDILKNYLVTKDENSLKNYIAVHQYRTQLLDQESIAYENAKEILEGMAAYVGFQSVNLNNQDKIQRIMTDPTFSAACSSPSDEKKIPDCIEHNRYYFIGPALGYALDNIAPTSWKETVELSGTTPDALLQQYYPMSQDEITQRVQHELTY